MYTGGCAVYSTAAFTVKSELSSFTGRRLCCTSDAAEAGDSCCSTGYISSPAPAFFARELSHSPAFAYSHYYYVRRRPAFLYRLSNPASYVTHLYRRWEARCRERALLGLATTRANASSGRRLYFCRCAVGPGSGSDPVCLCRGLLDDAGDEELLEGKEEEAWCCCRHDTVLIDGYCNSISREDEAEAGGYSRKAERERDSRHWDRRATSTADASASAIKNRKKANRVRTSTCYSASSTGFLEDPQSQKTPHGTPPRDERTSKSKVQISADDTKTNTKIQISAHDAKGETKDQISAHGTSSERNSHVTSLSEIRNSSSKNEDCFSKRVVDSRFSSRVGTDLFSDMSFQVKQDQVYAGKRSEEEMHSRKASEFADATCQADYNQRKMAYGEVNCTNDASLVASLVEEVRRQKIEIEKLRESYQALERRSNLQKSDRTEVVTRMETNEFISASVANLVEELRRQLIEINKLSRSYQELHSVAYQHDTEQLSRSNKLSNLVSNEREECSTSAVNLAKEEREQHIRHNQYTVDQKNVMNSAEVYEIDHHRTSSSYEVHKTKLRDEEERSTSTIYITEGSKKHSDDKEQRVISALHSIEEWKENLAHQAQSEGHQKRLGSGKLPESDSKFGPGPISFTSSRPKDEEVVPKFGWHTYEEGRHQNETSTSQGVIIDARLGSSNISDKSGSEELLCETNVLPETQVVILEGKSSLLEANVLSNTQGVILEGKSSQLEANVLPETQGVIPEGKSSLLSVHNLKNDRTQMTKFLEKGSGSVSSINDSYMNVDLGSVSTQTHMQQTQQLDGIYNNYSYNEGQDLLESARLLNSSSSSYVTEFVRESKKEASDTLEMDTSLAQFSTHMGELDNLEVNKESERVDTQSQQEVSAAFLKSASEKYTEEGQSQSTPLPQTGGPSDEMWDLSGSSQQASQKDKGKKEASEDVVDEISGDKHSGNAVAKRSGRSLWNIIAEIIRISWTSNAGKSQKSTTQSGTRSSSNESTGSEVWFSGHEPEEESSEPFKQKKKPPEEEPDVSKLQENAYPFSTKDEESIKPKTKDVHKDAGSLAGASNTQTAIVGSLTATGHLGLSVDEIVGVGTPVSGMPISSTSKNPVLSSAGSETEKPFINPIHEVIIGSSDHDTLKENETGEMDGDLRRRKFQRNKQVLRDRFDEWEEAHKQETEQREKDEFFMREALLEAKKAAELWEVPIGAVLVQNGKIIARSGNMVEECRDSTAHAEIVCIREASKLLRTWRLSETTLYVTLEPCAMCAGAILQARIDTVVWGAPNKLLGADGSWVRLFPGGVEENTSLNNHEQTVGPIHPFHPKINIRRGILGSECANVMQQFFQLRRKEKKRRNAWTFSPSGF